MATIKAVDNGPLLVSGECSIEDADGNAVTTQKVTALCRCGASKDKPYCDGSHNAIGFDSLSNNPKASDKLKTYRGESINVHFNARACAHAAVCVSKLNQVFDTQRRPWVQPDGADAEAVMAVVDQCPSGALSYSLADHEPASQASGEQSIRIAKNGPYLVNQVDLTDIELAEGVTADKCVLCRCGASSNKPFCDGSHKSINWQESE